MLRFLYFFLLVPSTLYAILPLPYPIEPLKLEQKKISPKKVDVFTDLLEGSYLREMELPNFDNPSDTLGYDKEATFTVPPRLRTRVNFWKKVFSQHTSSQAVLHDDTYLDIHYATLDISSITERKNLSYRAQRRLLRKLFKREKKKLKKKLKILHVLQETPLKIPVELFPIFKQFEKIKGKDRFLAARKRIRAQEGQREHIAKGFIFGGRFFQKMMEIFENLGIPKELTRLPLVESAFNLGARSKVGASGIWQFMRTTGKQFLMINSMVDERNDPIAATHAAAKLLRQNYKLLGAWPLAITAYNHGRAGIARAVRSVASRDLATIIDNYESRTFGFASANFYAEFLAILEIEKDFRKHFGKLKVDSPIQYREISIIENVKLDELALACSVPQDTLIDLNPALTNRVRSGKGYIPSGYILRVPPPNLTQCQSGIQNLISITIERYQ